jgi:hypothetical protein
LFDRNIFDIEKPFYVMDAHHSLHC